MAIISTFIYAQDSDFGPGLRPAWIPNSDPTTVVAHDILEHFPVDVPAAEGELMALGSYLALRLEMGTQRSSLSPQQVLAYEILGVYRYVLENNLTIAPKKTRKLNDFSSYAENYIQESAVLAYDLVLKEDFDGQEVTIPSQEVFSEAVISWIRTGYRKALARYVDGDLYTIGKSFFKKLDKMSEDLVKSGILSDGEAVTFTTSPRSGKITIRASGRRVEDYI